MGYLIISEEYSLTKIPKCDVFMLNTSCHKNQNDPINQAILQSYHLRRCEFGIPKSRVSGDVWGVQVTLLSLHVFGCTGCVWLRLPTPPLAYVRAMTSFEENVNFSVKKRLLFNAVKKFEQRCALVFQMSSKYL